ncbi:predicted protein [Verticillium alfalfae VaMs.102]|uniref:Predicted protein n=1 Tax=Verticillium alfalfae (strain VaMs.102 / ATCC MYA-4576 / FGSC 10136) TaxID=526221 RepID=C9SJ10_VERA1|nr:predicted protein [Verticillium alfalfae VaMs.102]EEY18933.1 predicted protein [Verticillium alfalfae VaMs.102]
MGKTIAAQAEDKGRTRGCAQRGVGLTSNDRRLVSDPLHFTGVDLGDRTGATRRSFPYQGSEDEEDDDITSSGDDDDYDEGAQLVLREREEEALVQSALARIQRAQDRGKKEVKLNKEELAALERRRKRIQEEEARSASSSSSSETSECVSQRSERKPLSTVTEVGKADSSYHLPLSIRPRRFASPSVHSAQSALARPDVFPDALEDHRGSSPFNPAAYSQPPSSHRHVSDTVSSRPRSSRGALPAEDAWTPGLSPASSSSSISRSRHSLDPHMFQSESSRAPYLTGAGATSRRHLAGPAEARRSSGPPAAARGGRSSRRPSPDETSEAASETSDPDTSDDLGNGVQIVDPPLRRGRQSEIVVEEEPADPRREVSRGKKSSNSSPVKRKPVASGRKKKK